MHYTTTFTDKYKRIKGATCGAHGRCGAVLSFISFLAIHAVELVPV